MSLVTITGGGSGQVVNVDDQCLQTRPKSEFEQAVEDGLAFSWATAAINIDATDTILAVENNSTAYDLCIERIVIGTATSTQMVVHTSSAVTMAGTAVTGLNLNRNSQSVAPATAKSDETGNGQAAASYSGGLWAGYVLANTSVTIEMGGAVVLPNDHCIGVDQTADAANATCTIVGYFKARA